MKTARLEAFSDGVFAIIITIMVLELKVPQGYTFDTLLPLLPIFLSYILSFVYVGIYWNNHHHMLMVSKRVSGKVLWANLHLLFWLSLFPFVTAWMGQNQGNIYPTILYGVVLLAAASAFLILQHTIIVAQGTQSVLRSVVGLDGKGKLSILLYVVAIIAAYVAPWIAQLLYATVALMWIVPDKRYEKAHAGINA